MDRRKVIYFALWVAIFINISTFCLLMDARCKEIEVPPPSPGEISMPFKSPKVPTQTVAQCYCWVDASGNMTWGQLKNVPMECFQGFDKIKGWSRGLIQKPVVGR